MFMNVSTIVKIASSMRLISRKRDTDRWRHSSTKRCDSTWNLRPSRPRLCDGSLDGRSGGSCEADRTESLSEYSGDARHPRADRVRDPCRVLDAERRRKVRPVAVYHRTRLWTGAAMAR